MDTSEDGDQVVLGDHDISASSNLAHPAALTISNWLREHGSWLHPSLTIQPLEDAQGGLSKHSLISSQWPTPLGVFLSPSASPLPIPSGTPLCLIPKTSCLSPRTSALQSHLRKLNIDLVFGPEAASGLLLSFCLLYEKELGEDSMFHGYIQSLPCERADGHFGIPLPLEGGGSDSLDRSETGRILHRADSRSHQSDDTPGWPSHSTDAMSLSLLRSFFDSIVSTYFSSHLTCSRSHDPPALWDAFIGCYSLVSSRAFVCDTFHGLALVPLADIFNHAEPAQNGEEDDTVQQHVQFECEDLVCTRCGSLLDEKAESCRQNCRKERSRDHSTPALKDSLDEEDLIYMTTIVPLYPSPTHRLEVFNNYGPLSPARLLASYGFVDDRGPRNVWERYSWDWRNSLERDEIFNALCLMDQEIDPIFPKAPKADRVKPHRQIELDSQKLQKWSHLVRLLTESCGIDVEDLFPPISNSLRSSTGLLPLPKSSPFLPLGTMDRTSQTKDALSHRNSSIELLISPNSSHSEYSADKILPLFVDGEGRISTSLWVICLLAAIVHSPPSRGEETQDGWRWTKEGLSKLVVRIQRRANERISSSLLESSPQSTSSMDENEEEEEEEEGDDQLMSKTAVLLLNLIQRRYIALDLLLTSPSSGPSEQGSDLNGHLLQTSSSHLLLASNERKVLSSTMEKIQLLIPPLLSD